MLLIAGLGNPGARYAKNRHNIGFMAVEAIAREHRYPPFRSRFQGLIADGTIGGVRAALLMPQTFMNDSGQSVGEAMRFFKLDLKAVVVLHDELDLAPGKCRVKVGGGNAGHNGLRSITAHIGNDYKRVRLGIGHPGAKELVYPLRARRLRESGDGLGRGALRRHRPPRRASRARRGRELPEQGASGDGSGGVRRESRLSLCASFVPWW